MIFMEYRGSSANNYNNFSHNANNVPYTRIGLDLNLGAGDFIFMVYKAKTLPPVKDMGVALVM